MAAYSRIGREPASGFAGAAELYPTRKKSLPAKEAEPLSERIKKTFVVTGGHTRREASHAKQIGNRLTLTCKAQREGSTISRRQIQWPPPATCHARQQIL